jgi:23S rRNA (adenine2503-C2)-methyltransferase
MKKIGLAKYRAGQLYSWLHQKGAQSYDQMSDLPKELRSSFSLHFPILDINIIRKQESKFDGTIKYLFRLNDGEFIESVLMQYKYGYTLCVSTQVGCRMGCKFCATAIGGLIRNLRPSEMLDQIYLAQQDLNIRISHIVLMGMGEPLDNFKNVMRFLELVSDENGLNIGMRNISLSTCGIVPAIYLLLDKHLQLTLSVSIHAPNDEIRSQIMPVNDKYNIEMLLDACGTYAKTTSRRISFEYAMLEEINDSAECAKELAERVKGILCHVNLIQTNEISENSYRRTTAQKLDNFEKILNENGINVTIRRSLGSDIDAACGQLRSRLSK